MQPDDTGNFWHEFFRGWPLWLRISLVVAAFLIVAFAVFSAIFLAVERQEDIEIGLRGFKATRPETTLEKNCRIAGQEASARDKSFNSEILSLQAQVAIKDHDLSETRQKCLALASVNRAQSESRCRTEISQSNGWVSTFANPHGDYETELTGIAEERYSLQAKIAAMEQERAQWRQRLDAQCLGIGIHEPTTKGFHTP